MLKKMILKNTYFIFYQKRKKKEIAWHKGEDCIKFLLNESEEWKNIYIDKFHNWKYNYSLLFENENDYNDMEYFNYRTWTGTRADILVDKIKEKKRKKLIRLYKVYLILLKNEKNI